MRMAVSDAKQARGWLKQAKKANLVDDGVGGAIAYCKDLDFQALGNKEPLH